MDNPGLRAIIQDEIQNVLSDPNNIPDAVGSFVTSWQQVNPVPVKPVVPRPLTVTLAYSASITPDASAGTWQTVTVTNGTAFTVNAPIVPPDQAHTQKLTIEVFNSSGGAMGAITWNSAFVFNGVTWANPANTKKRYVTFGWNGSKWVATSFSGADY